GTGAEPLWRHLARLVVSGAAETAKEGTTLLGQSLEDHTRRLRRIAFQQGASGSDRFRISYGENSKPVRPQESLTTREEAMKPLVAGLAIEKVKRIAELLG
ncbi:MAG: hypothetical protein ACLP53_02735, partial [Isosphaeraceae bacterium]